MSPGSALRWLGRRLASLAFSLLLVGAGFWLHFLWSGPTLEPWHTAQLDAEFTADDYASGRVTTLAQYRERERDILDQVRTEIVERVEPKARLAFNRFNAGSRSDPGTWETNWNLTFVLEPSGTPKAGVLLLHGLTDSPYSMLSIGRELTARGARVVGLRLPGHGTAPAGLLHAEVEDMQAATELAMRDLRASLGQGQPVYMVGYSNGAALSVSYALDALERTTLPRPDGLVLISPAIGITRLAALGRIRTGLSDVPGFGRAAWQTIATEVDPYKYQSFPFHAAGITQRLTITLTRRVRSLADAGKLAGFPRTLAFVSTVDSTVHAGAVSESLLAPLGEGGHELVLFDVNRLSMARQLLVDDPGPLTRRLVEEPGRNHVLTLVTNADPQTASVVARRYVPREPRATEQPLGTSWPRSVFSLSHVALPFAPDDPLYGYDAPLTSQHVQLGRLELRGETGVLDVPLRMLMRLRSNPFHAYLAARIEQAFGLENSAVGCPAPGSAVANADATGCAPATAAAGLPTR